MASVECAIDGWSRDGEEIGEIADGILAHGMHAAEFPLLSVGQLGCLARNFLLARAMAMPSRVRMRMRSASNSAKVFSTPHISGIFGAELYYEEDRQAFTCLFHLSCRAGTF